MRERGPGNRTAPRVASRSSPVWDRPSMRGSSLKTLWPVAGGVAGAVAALTFRAVLDGGITGPAVVFALAFGVTWAGVGLAVGRRRAPRREPSEVPESRNLKTTRRRGR